MNRLLPALCAAVALAACAGTSSTAPAEDAQSLAPTTPEAQPSERVAPLPSSELPRQVNRVSLTGIERLRLVAEGGSRTFRARGAGLDVGFGKAVQLEVSGASLRLEHGRLEGMRVSDAMPTRRDEQTLEYAITHNLAEQWVIRDHVVEQRWIFPAAPAAGQPIVVQVPFQGMEVLTQDAKGVVLGRHGIPKVHYSHARFVDAEGTQTLVPVTVSDDQLVLSVPAATVASSTFPAVLDPTISGVLDTLSTNGGAPQVAYAPGLNQYLVGFMYDSGSIRQGYVVRVEGNGTPIDDTPLQITSGSHDKRSLHIRANQNLFLISWQDRRDVSSRAFTWENFSQVMSRSPPTGAAVKTELISGSFTSFLVGSGFKILGDSGYSSVNTNGTVWELNAMTVGGSAGVGGDPLYARLSSNLQGLIGDGELNAWWYDSRLQQVRGTAGVVTHANKYGAWSRSMATNGNVHLLVYSDSSSNPEGLGLYALRLADDGSALDPSPIRLGSGETNVMTTATVFDGKHFVVIAGTYQQLLMWRLTPEGQLVDASPTALVTYGWDQGVGHAAASDGAGHVLLAYALRGSPSTVETRLIDLTAAGPQPNGASCSSGFVCASGLCIDGRCCNSACGYGAPNDCQACSVSAGAAEDGVCSNLDPSHICRPTTGPCDTAETCTSASTSCPPNAVKEQGTVCGPAAEGPCDVDDLCDGKSVACRSDVRLGTEAICRPSRGACDSAEACDGVGLECPPDQRIVDSVCRPSAGGCDAAELCNGQQDDCPADRPLARGTVCRAAASVCDAAESCDGVNYQCPVNQPAVAGTECRAVLGPCDVPESCDGAGFACPADSFKVGKVCRVAADVCDAAESCDGTGAQCPNDGFQPAATSCREAKGACDRAESCTGNSPTCPTDSVLPNSVRCRASAGACDVDEYCTGASAQCPIDVVEPSGVLCRLPSESCDPAEVCDGSSAACPEDIACGPSEPPPYTPPKLPAPAPAAGPSGGDPEVGKPSAPSTPTSSSGGCTVTPTGVERAPFLMWFALLGFAVRRLRRGGNAAGVGLCLLLWHGCGSDPVPTRHATNDTAARGSDASADSPGETPVDEACRDDDDCPTPGYCDPLDAKCAARGTRGRLCDVGRCEVGTYCGEGMRCKEQRAIGEPCEGTEMCLKAECREGMCTPVGGAGQACTERQTCATGLACVGGLCIDPGSRGNPCLPGRACDPNLTCVDNRCEPWGYLDQACLPHDTCHDQLVCVSGRCANPGTNGAPCRSGGACDANLYCDSNVTCKPKGAYGAACSKDDHCAAGYCGVALAEPTGSTRTTCLRDDKHTSLISDPRGSCTYIGYDVWSGNDSDICGSERCRRECGHCLVSWRNNLVAFALCERR